MTALFLAAFSLLGEAPGPEVTPAFDPFVVVGVCPIATGARPWSVVFHQFGEEMPEAAQVASVRVFKVLESPAIDACLTRIVEEDAEASRAADALASALDPDTYAKMDAAVRAAWSRYGVDAAVREVAREGKAGPAVERLSARCEALRARSD